MPKVMLLIGANQVGGTERQVQQLARAFPGAGVPASVVFLERPGRRPASRRLEQVKDQRIAQLEEKLIQKNEVIAELMEENVRAKKANGEL